MRHPETHLLRSRTILMVLVSALASAGCATLGTVSYVEPAPVAHVPPRSNAESVRMESLNTGLLPHVFGTDNLRRARHIAWRYKGAHKPDVVVLLEVFDERARTVLVRELEEDYPWIVSRSGGASFLPEDSGILLASRLPVVRNGKPRLRFKPFNERGPITRSDHWATKGVLGAELDLGGNKSLCLLATHLMADYEVMGQYAAIRRRQLEEVREFGRAFLAEVPAGRKSTTILVGDLNVPAEISTPREFGLAARIQPTNEYQGLKEILLSPRDLYRESNPLTAGHTWNHDPYAPGAEPKLGPWRLDYALELSGLKPAARRAETQFVRVRAFAMQPGVTDHRGLAIELGRREHFPLTDTIAAAPVPTTPTAPVVVAEAAAPQHPVSETAPETVAQL